MFRGGWDDNKKSQETTATPSAAKVETEKRAQKVFQLAKNGQDFKVLARNYSELPTAADGGDIGVFELEDMAPFMKDAVIDLQPGEISTLIETGSGYQFFKLLARIDSSADSFEAAKDDLREELYEQRLNEEFNEWVKELKEDAVIKRF